MANLYSEKPIVEIIAIQGKDGTELPIDDEMSSTSENPVQNKVVKQAIDNAVTTAEEYASGAVENAYQQLDEEKQDVLEDSGAGQNIKTINGQSILGTGDLEVGSQIDVDDVLNPTSENPVMNRVLFSAFNDLNSEVIGTVERLANRVYGIAHEAVTTDDLENDYNLIINGGYQRLYFPPIDWAENYATYYYKDELVYRLNESFAWDWNREYYKRLSAHSNLASVSAVGMVAILKHGEYTAVTTQPSDWDVNYANYFYLTSDGYKANLDPAWNPNRSYYSYSGDVVRTQGNTMFIDAEKSEDYTFRGLNSDNGIELVKAWYFGDGAAVSLQESVTFDMIELSIKTKNTIPDINANNLNSQTVVTDSAYSGIVASNIIKTIKFTNNTVGTIPTVTQNVMSNITTLNNNVLGGKTNLQSATLPELTTIAANAGGKNKAGFADCSKLSQIVFPKLLTIGDGRDWQAIFNNVVNVELPKSVKTIGNYCVGGNKTVVLNCNEADTISDLWCLSAPSVSFSLCSDWEATINIAKAARDWSPGKFGIPPIGHETDLYYLINLLKTVEYVPTAHTIKIPQAYVTDDLIDAYLEKGWDLVAGIA